MKIIIAGSRTFNDYDLLKNTCDKLLSNLNKEDIEIISGTANGADKLGERYAKDNGLKLKRFPADWNQYGKKAGFIRNEEMAKYGQGLIVFWDGQSKGTKHMIDIGTKYNLKIKKIIYENNKG